MSLKVQEFIHRLEEGAGSRHLKLALAFIVAAALLAGYDLLCYRNLTTEEGMDAAQLARNVAAGRGYTTSYIRPFSIFLLNRHHEKFDPAIMENHPDLAQPPVYPGLLAALMKVLPARQELQGMQRFQVYRPDLGIALFNQGLFLIAVWLTFRLARRLFDEPVAWMAAAVLLGSELFWRFSVSGLSTLLLLVIFLGVSWCLVALEQAAREGRRGAGWLFGLAIATGVFVGLGGLTRYAFMVLIVPVCAYQMIFFGPQRIKLAFTTLAACAVVMTPWVARNFNVSGTPFGTAGYALLQNTTAFGENELERTLNPDLGRVEAGNYLRKLVEGLRPIVSNDLPRLGGSWVTAFFLAGLLVPFRNPGLARLRYFLLLSLVVLCVAQALGRTHLTGDSPEVNSENLLVLLAPLAFIYGAGLFSILLDQLALRAPPLRLAAIGGFILAASAPLALAWLPPRPSPIVWPPYHPPAIQRAAGWMKEKDLMISDFPWAVAWYGDRQCALLTVEYKSDPTVAKKNGYRELDDYKPIKALYLSPKILKAVEMQTLIRGLEGKGWSWENFVLEALVHREIPADFPLRKAAADFLYAEQLFLSDVERWKSSGN